ncbi:MBL fold metallo-hydrolase [Nonomuraea sp. NPDC026600]|uniref:MBL fold metallo-hydrolase n=1 Tax=Nonomuraea sp. NPDC026600 TaxID=3155363 RepID=UPI0033DEAE1E
MPDVVPLEHLLKNPSGHDEEGGRHDRLDPGVTRETAAAQIRSLGYTTDDVRHIVLTHLDFDHIGGLADFASAVVHTTAAEQQAAMITPGEVEKQRYRPVQWAHRPIMSLYEGPGEPWRGFTGAYQVNGLDDRFALSSTAAARTSQTTPDARWNPGRSSGCSNSRPPSTPVPSPPTTAGSPSSTPSRAFRSSVPMTPASSLRSQLSARICPSNLATPPTGP